MILEAGIVVVGFSWSLSFSVEEGHLIINKSFCFILDMFSFSNRGWVRRDQPQGPAGNFSYSVRSLHQPRGFCLRFLPQVQASPERASLAGRMKSDTSQPEQDPRQLCGVCNVEGGFRKKGEKSGAASHEAHVSTKATPSHFLDKRSTHRL